LGFLEEEPLGGTLPTARRYLKFYTILGFPDALPGGDELSPGDAGLKFGFRHFGCFDMILIGGKSWVGKLRMR